MIRLSFLLKVRLRFHYSNPMCLYSTSSLYLVVTFCLKKINPSIAYFIILIYLLVYSKSPNFSTAICFETTVAYSSYMYVYCSFKFIIIILLALIIVLASIILGFEVTEIDLRRPCLSSSNISRYKLLLIL